MEYIIPSVTRKEFSNLLAHKDEIMLAAYHNNKKLENIVHVSFPWNEKENKLCVAIHKDGKRYAAHATPLNDIEIYVVKRMYESLKQTLNDYRKLEHTYEETYPGIETFPWERNL